MMRTAKSKTPDTATVETLYREYGPRVRRLAFRLLGNAADAEDVVQDVFLHAQRSLSTFRGDAALSTWLYRVAVNAALAYRRSRASRDHDRVRTDDMEEFVDKNIGRRLALHPVISEPLQKALDHEQQRLVDEAVAQLPQEQRDAVVLADLEELPLPEVAELLGLTLPALKSRLHRGRMRLRERLAPQRDRSRSAPGEGDTSL